MPNSKSAKKRLRTSLEARDRNLGVKTGVKKARRSFMEAAAGAEGVDPKESYRNYCSILDKAVKQGVLTRNTAIRRKTRAANKIRIKA